MPAVRRWFLLAGLLAGLAVIVPGRLGRDPARATDPQLILVLGGEPAREQWAARIARRSRLPVLVSGGTNPEFARWVFARAGLPPGRVRLDYRARDTLGNFTTVADDLRRSGVRHVLLVTSEDHMDRALLVGRVVAGSRGIRLTPAPVPCAPRCLPESRRKIWGDGLRALVWVVSGRDLRLLVEQGLG
jgi:uncharacterized SAM-binding protein YcdF (DUF218 family)